MVDCSVIIPAYNAKETLLEIIELLNLQCQFEEYTCEIIIINSSKDDLQFQVNQRFPAVQFFQLQQQTFPGPARNIGFQHSTGDFLIFLDADVYIQNNGLKEMLDELQRNSRSIIGGGLQNQSSDNIASQLNHIFEYQDFHPNTPAGTRRFIPSCFLGCSRETFLQIGGFPTRTYGSEDVYFGEIASKLGIKIIFNPAFQVNISNRRKISDVLIHFHSHGISAGRMRFIFSLSGHWLCWFFPLWPVLFIYRGMRVCIRAFRFKLSPYRQMPLLFILFFTSAFCWTFGFISGYFIELGKKFITPKSKI